MLASARPSQLGGKIHPPHCRSSRDLNTRSNLLIYYLHFRNSFEIHLNLHLLAVEFSSGDDQTRTALFRLFADRKCKDIVVGATLRFNHFG